MGSLRLCSIGPILSTGSPITLMTRPKAPFPTGIDTGPPSSSAGMPRTIPSVGWRAIVAHAAFTEVLLYFDDDIDRSRYLEPFARDVQRLVDRRLLAFLKLHVDCRTDHL